jgi:putative nucleotidyltransferase with HDIG domain
MNARVAKVHLGIEAFCRVPQLSIIFIFRHSTHSDGEVEMIRKRLLFVDDELLVLDALRGALRDMRFEWETSLVDGGPDGLPKPEHKKYDAIATDTRIPVTDGTPSLEEVQNHHEDVRRVLPSAQSNKESILHSQVTTHQFLKKPSDTEDLKLRLNLAFSMRDAVENGILKTMVGRLRSMPSLPNLYNELTSALASPDTSLSQLERIIEKDLGMATKILQLANSAFVAARSQVSTLKQAIALIGTDAIRTLALSVHVFSQFEGSSAVKEHLPSLWEHSAAVASLARQIAATENQPGPIREQSFTAGLLHDIGRAILLAELPKEYLPILAQAAADPAEVLPLETETFGCTHAQIGAYLLSTWGLPPELVHVVALHHRPSDEARSQFSPLTAVHCADVIAGGNSPATCDGVLDTVYLERLGLTERMPVWQGLCERSQI